jgi:hypothetical protein
MASCSFPAIPPDNPTFAWDRADRTSLICPRPTQRSRTADGTSRPADLSSEEIAASPRDGACTLLVLLNKKDAVLMDLLCACEENVQDQKTPSCQVFLSSMDAHVGLQRPGPALGGFWSGVARGSPCCAGPCVGEKGGDGLSSLRLQGSRVPSLGLGDCEGRLIVRGREGEKQGIVPRLRRPAFLSLVRSVAALCSGRRPCLPVCPLPNAGRVPSHLPD